jgi:hypothetical protein
MIGVTRIFRLGIRLATWATPHVKEWHRRRHVNRLEGHRHLDASNWSDSRGTIWDLHILDDPSDPVAFQLPYGTWIRLFRENRLGVEDLIELRPPADASSSYRNDADREWARRWPMEHIWRVRRLSRI